MTRVRAALALVIAAGRVHATRSAARRVVSLVLVAALGAGCPSHLRGAVDATLPDRNPVEARPASEVVDAAVASADPSVRAVALSARVAAADSGDALARWAIQGSHDPDPWVQRLVARALIARIAEPAAIEMLGEIVARASADPYVRVEIGLALRDAGHADLLAPLAGAYGRQVAWRAAPLALLATWGGDPAAPAVLQGALSSADVRDDRGFVVALGRSGLPDIDGALAEAGERLEEIAPRFAFARALLGTSDGLAAWSAAQGEGAARDAVELIMELPLAERAAWARTVDTGGDPGAKAALRLIRSPSADRIRRAMGHDDPWIRKLAIDLAEQLDARQAEGVAELGLADGFDEVRVGAASLAGRFDLEALRPALDALLVDDHLLVRTAAAAALVRMDAR